MTDTPRPLDQAPAADPALDAVDVITRQAHGYVKRLGYTDAADAHAFVDATAATIRDALADRITPAEAHILVAVLADGWLLTIEERSALIARLGKIGEAGR